MSIYYFIVRDLFRASLATWLVLLVIELARPSGVQRLINLEYFFYFLVFLFILLNILQKKD